MDILSKLNKGLKFGSSSSGASLIHENEKSILDAATQFLNQSAAGQQLLNFAQENRISMHVLRGAEKYGYFPEKSEVYISCPAGRSMPGVEAVIYLAGGLREAMLQATDGLKRPNPAIGKERFISTQIEREADIAAWQTLVVHEVAESTGLREIIDAFERMGYASLLEAHRLDLDEKTTKL